jgi:hypothetical protein
VSDRNSDGSNSTYGGSNPPAAPTSDVLKELWRLWLIQKHNNQLIKDRAWLHLDHPSELVSQLTKTIEWHKAPGIWGLFLVPLKGTTTIEYKDSTVKINKPIIVQTNVLHRWIPNEKDNVFWAYKIKCITK